MKILKKINLKLGKDQKTIYFGIPDNSNELDEMYRFRYSIYLKYNYITENSNKEERDEYDDGRSTYFTAKIDDRLIGTVRLIRDEYLPTEKECFKFDEPVEMTKISRNHRAELGRLIVDKYSEKIFLPRHLVLLGLLSCVVDYALNNNLEGGYSFIKDSLNYKLRKLRFPFLPIKNFQQVYSGGTLDKYFKDKKDSVRPVYYLTKEVENYLKKIFNNPILFKKNDHNKFILKNEFIFKIISLLHAL